MCYAGGRIVNRRIKVLAETGGAVSALTPHEHTVLCQQAQRFSLRYRVHNSWQQAAERYVSLLCSLTTGDARMGGMDIIILILKLMVAVLQLLDAVLKQFR